MPRDAALNHTMHESASSDAQPTLSSTRARVSSAHSSAHTISGHEQQRRPGLIHVSTSAASLAGAAEPGPVTTIDRPCLHSRRLPAEQRQIMARPQLPRRSLSSRHSTAAVPSARQNYHDGDDGFDKNERPPPPVRTARSTGHVRQHDLARRSSTWYTSALDLRSRLRTRDPLAESTPLLGGRDSRSQTASYLTLPAGLRQPRLNAWQSQFTKFRRGPRWQERRASHSRVTGNSDLRSPDRNVLSDSPTAGQKLKLDDRTWYDQFTSTDWVHDSIADAFRVKELRSRTDIRGRIRATLDGAQGWLIVLIIGAITASFAYCIDRVEATVFDYKEGYCSTAWWRGLGRCCNGADMCDDWTLWSEVGRRNGMESVWVDFTAFICWVVLLAVLSCIVTLQTKTTVSSHSAISTLDENLAAEHHHTLKNKEDSRYSRLTPVSSNEKAARTAVVYYPAAGSGVAEVKVILSGFVLHGYLGVRTLFCKSIGLILSGASGLSLGKEGPYVHIATCIGNIASRFFRKYRDNEAKRREVLAAAAASGVAVAFGAPIGGVLFSLEEVSYYFPHKTLFRTFFCCIAATLSLKFLDPYGTGKIVLFQVRYQTDWKFFEILGFIVVGALGGLIGAMFIKASRFWARNFRSITLIRTMPILEVLVVAVATGLVSFWNRYTRIPVAELLFEIAAPCNAFFDSDLGLCPTPDRIPSTIRYLTMALIVKWFLTIVTFGMKVPAGIYVPSMVIGGLMGRIVGHIIQWITLFNPALSNFVGCPVTAEMSPESCVVPGVYALVGAGATMCGVTRLSVTLAVILFELTGSLEHVLPFSLGVLVAKWTADAIEPLSIYDLLTDMNGYPYLDSKVRPVFTSDLGDITPALNSMRYIDISLSPLVPARHLRAKLEYVQSAGELDGGLPILRDGILVGLIPAPDLNFALDRIVDERNALCLMSPQHKWLGPALGTGRGTTSSSDENQDKTNLGNGEEAEDSNSNSDTVDDNSDDGAGSDNSSHDGWLAQSVISDQLLLDTARHRQQPQQQQQQQQQKLQQQHSPLSSQPSRSPPTDLTQYIDPAPVTLDVYSSMDLVFECFVKLGLRYICVLHEGSFAGLVHKKSFVRYVKEVHKGTEL